MSCSTGLGMHRLLELIFVLGAVTIVSAAKAQASSDDKENEVVHAPVCWWWCEVGHTRDAVSHGHAACRCCCCFCTCMRLDVKETRKSYASRHENCESKIQARTPSWALIASKYHVYIILRATTAAASIINTKICAQTPRAIYVTRAWRGAAVSPSSIRIYICHLYS
uniref:Secreted protein n=1 Tax=Trichogramma kaykai TaxID=54128 RepID=A0ABD2WM04_9HYME